MPLKNRTRVRTALLPFLQELFSAESPMGKQFLAKINEYNDCFAMTSFGHEGTFIGGLRIGRLC